MKICCETGKEIKTDMDRLGCQHDHCIGDTEMTRNKGIFEKRSEHQGMNISPPPEVDNKMGKIEKAYYFAMAAHAALGQNRMYTGEPYIVHPVEVCDILTGHAAYFNGEMCCAALLHDVVEDTHVSLELIYKEFGSCVGDLVEGLTDISKPEDGNRKIRKEIDRQHTSKQSPACKTIKLADLISNTRSICEHDKEFAKVYVKEKELLLEVLTEGDATLYKQAYDLMVKCKEELGIV